MIILITVRKLKVARIALLLLAALVLISNVHSFYNTEVPVFADEQIVEVIQQMFKSRDKAIIEGDAKRLEELYDRGVLLGNWAYEHQIKKLKYLHMWANKQGIKFIDSYSKIKVNRINKRSGSFSATLSVTTEYKYSYEDEPDIINLFKLGTYHSLQMTAHNDNWVIIREWYTDPFADSLTLTDIKSEEVKSYILHAEPRNPSVVHSRRISALQYADRYCGGNSTQDHDFAYNKNYRNYNYSGGDCANFVSQALFEGGNFKKTGSWNYNNKGATKAWLNANALKNYMLNSGRGSLIARGTYLSVFKSSYKLEPGDIVAYEKKGKVAHVSIVTAADSKGYALVSCHNADRYRVPWDLGWSDAGIKFWLIKVHY